jgi:DNA-binding Lrp family transcriptional regulator
MSSSTHATPISPASLRQTPAGIDDPVNRSILSISEDRIQGFQIDPMGAISGGCGVEVDTVIDRLQAMMRAGTIRRVRQTLMATNLAQGSLVAWNVPHDSLEEAFAYMFERDPFSGHVVIRSTDGATAGSKYRLWTTLKAPQGFSIAKHAEFLRERVGADSFLLMPAKCLFALGVGHIRRRDMEIGSKSDALADVIDTRIAKLSEIDWRVLTVLKREFEPDEICCDLWRPRAAEAGVDLETFAGVARSLSDRGVIGRFSTFLEHVKPTAGDLRVTRYNALFHWAVPQGREIETGREVGRFHIMTHAYWREGGPEFGGVNIMGVAHGTDKDVVIAHKKSIDEHLAVIGIPVSYTNVFWGGRSEIKPSEIAPQAYVEFCEANGLDPDQMRDSAATAL